MIDECCYEHVLLTLLLWFSPLMLSGSVFSSFAVNVVDPLALRCASHIQKDDHVNIPQSDLHVFSSLSLSSLSRNCAVLKLFFENSHSVAQRDYFLNARYAWTDLIPSQISFSGGSGRRGGITISQSLLRFEVSLNCADIWKLQLSQSHMNMINDARYRSQNWFFSDFFPRRSLPLSFIRPSHPLCFSFLVFCLFFS